MNDSLFLKVKLTNVIIARARDDVKRIFEVIKKTVSKTLTVL